MLALILFVTPSNSSCHWWQFLGSKLKVFFPSHAKCSTFSRIGATNPEMNTTGHLYSGWMYIFRSLKPFFTLLPLNPGGSLSLSLTVFTFGMSNDCYIFKGWKDRDLGRWDVQLTFLLHWMRSQEAVVPLVFSYPSPSTWLIPPARKFLETRSCNIWNQQLHLVIKMPLKHFHFPQIMIWNFSIFLHP